MNPETSLPTTSPISFWLVPAEPNRLELTTLINSLADKNSAPRFMPHVTLLVTQLAKDESPQQIMESATKAIAPLDLDLLGLEHGPNRFKSLFIRLNSKPVEPLFKALRNSCRHPGSYQLDVHLSLLYLQVPITKRIALLADLHIPEGPFHFDTVIAVTPGHNQICFDEVEQWRYTDKVILTPSLCCPPGNGNS